MRRKPLANGEEGSALVLALVFITVVSLLIGATLAFAQVSVRYGDSLAERRNNLYTAEGAVEAAISRVESGRACLTTDLELNGVTPTASCIPPMPGGSEGSDGGLDRAIVAFGSVEGIVQTTDSEPIEIGGDIFSNADVTATATGGITAIGAVEAVGACTAEVTATPASDRRCSNDTGQAVTPMAQPPAMAMDLAAVPDPSLLPDCAGSGVVELDPGYYDDAVSLSRLTTADDAGELCDGGRVLSFRPGVYYFNFDYRSASPCAVAADCVWTVDDPDIKVVGGTAVRPQASVTVPGACTGNDPGVQFVFGGQSQLQVLDGAFEMCPYEGVAGDASIYGFATPTAAPDPVPFTDLDPSTVESTTFTSQAAATDIDSLLAPSQELSSATPTASITLSGYPTSAVPEGARITSASLLVSHYQDEANVLDVTATVSGVAAPIILRDDCTTICPETIPISLSAEDIDGLEVTYSLALKAGQVGPTFGSLDGISISFTYTAPYLQPLGGCHDPPPPIYPAASRCALVKGRAPSVLAVGGPVYAPTAVVDVELDDISRPVFARGMVVRTAHLGLTDATASTPPMVGLSYRPALVAVGQSVDDGIRVAGEPLIVEGDVQSRSKIVVDHPDDGEGLVVNGSVRAGGACTSGEIRTQAGTAPDCSNTDVVNAEADPGYTPPTGTPTMAPDPVCGPGIVEVEAGWHDDAAALTALTDGTCDAEVVWFKPGLHYFDFDFSGAAGCDTPPGSACVWTIDNPDVKVVGGAGSPAWASGPSFSAANVTFPAGCNPNVAGAEFVFGGPSRVDLQAGSLEVCAGPREDPVAIHGLSGPLPDEAPAQATQTASADFTVHEAAIEIGELPTPELATATLVGGSAAVTLSGFAGTIPPGSRIDSVKALVAHREDAGVATPTVTGTVDPITGSPRHCEVLCTDALAITGVTDVAGLSGLSLTYTVSGSGTADLDGIELEVSYYPPGYEPLSGCLVEDTGTPGACALLTAGGTAKLAVQGIVYAPSAGVDVDLDDVSTPVFGQGLVARTMDLDISTLKCPGDSGNVNCYEGPAVFGSNGAGSDEYEFTVFMDERPRLRARVEIVPGGVEPSKIRSWNVLP